jgi:hypothetical protein
MSLSLLAAVERARARFRQDVADQLRIAVGKAGLTATVTLDPERAVLELDAALPEGALPGVVAAFNDDGHGEPGGSDRVIVRVETGEERNTLLTLAWLDDPGLDEEAALQRRLAELEARTDERLPLERRGLNAAADVRGTSSAPPGKHRGRNHKPSLSSSLPVLSCQERRIDGTNPGTADGAGRKHRWPATSKRSAPM